MSVLPVPTLPISSTYCRFLKLQAFQFIDCIPSHFRNGLKSHFFKSHENRQLGFPYPSYLPFELPAFFFAENQFFNSSLISLFFFPLETFQELLVAPEHRWKVDPPA